MLPALIPYYAPPALRLGDVLHRYAGFDTEGDLVLDSWLLLVIGGVIAGTEFARWRAIKRGLSVKVTVDCVLFMLLCAFAMAHIVHVVIYNPHLIDEIGWQVLSPLYGGFSSYGGFFGAAIAIPVFLRWKKVPAWAYADNIAIAFWLGWTLGRFGCFTAHDHIGRESSFFLAVDFPFGPRHDLGLYEALVSLGLFVGLLWLDRNRKRFHGFFLGTALLLYTPARFLLDFLRANDLELVRPGMRSDVRFSGLTPAQYGSLAIFALGVWVLWSRHDKGQQDTDNEASRDRGSSAPAPPQEGEGEQEQGQPG